MRITRGMAGLSRWRIGVAMTALALAGCGGGSSTPTTQNSIAPGSTSQSSSTSTATTSVKAGTGEADVSWTPPTTTTDGSTLLNLAGYDIYYGTSPSALTNRVKITNIGVTNYVISGLKSGAWYFVVTSYTAQGTESVPSNVVSKTIT